MHEALNPIDAIFWSLESPTTRQEIAAILLFDRAPDFAAFKERMEEIIRFFPRLKQRVLRKKGYYWEDEPEFELTEHVHLVVIRAMKSETELIEQASKLFSEGLNKATSPWRFHILSNYHPLQDALPERPLACAVLKIHHALADGLGGMQLVEILAKGVTARMQRIKVAKGQANEGTACSAEKTAVSPWRNLGSGPQGKGAAGAKKLRSLLYLLGEYREPRGCGLLNGKNSMRRELTLDTLHLMPLKHFRQKTHCSFNDVVLTLLSGALRRYHEMKQVPAAKMRAVIPVSFRQLSERYSLGNRLTGVGVWIAPHLSSVSKRLHFISNTFSRLKERGEIAAYTTLVSLISVFPVRVQRAICEFQAKRTNFICSTIPHSSTLKEICGAQVRGSFGAPALMREHGVAFSFLPYGTQLCISIISDPEVLDDPQILMQCIKESHSEISQSLLLGSS